MDISNRLQVFENNTWVALCPWCDGTVIITARNCNIFRHSYDANGQQLNPHSKKDECIHKTKYGCGYPFKIENDMLVKCSFDT